MTIALNDLNWLATAVAWIALVLLGGLWFAALFPRAYNRSLGREATARPVSTPLFLAGPPLTALVVTVTSAVLLAALDVRTLAGALLFGLVVGLGYLTATTVTIAINPNFPRPLAYAAISGGYQLGGSLLVSAILVSL